MRVSRTERVSLRLASSFLLLSCAFLSTSTPLSPPPRTSPPLASEDESPIPRHNDPQIEEDMIPVPNARDEEWFWDHPPTTEKSKWAFLQRTSSLSEAAALPRTKMASLAVKDEEEVDEEADEPQQLVEESQDSDEEQQNDASQSVAHEDLNSDLEFDDRTLLDVFAESAKEYLTTKLIPLTDPECRWDWRNLRCEPACQCHFQYQAGDYHLGRSCRLVAEEELLEVGQCRANASEHIFDQPVPKRILSLVGQTSQILLSKSTRALLRIKVLKQLQLDVCEDLWSWQESQHDSEDCWRYPDELPILRTIPERLLCGPVTLPECPDDARVQ